MSVEVDLRGRWKTAWITTSNYLEVAGLLEERIVNCICINPNKSPGVTLELLKKVPEPEGLEVTDVEKVDITPVESMRSLRYLLLGNERAAGIDFTKFKRLENLRINFHPGDLLPSPNVAIKAVYIGGYKPRSTELTEFGPYPQLVKLELVQPNIHSLRGIENLVSLKHLELYYCRNLTSIAGLSKTPVARIHFGNCPNIKDFEILGECPDLESIRIPDCRSIPSLEFMNDSPKLKECRIGSTNVLDGDMSPMFRMKSFWFVNKKHYSHKSSDVDRFIERRDGSRIWHTPEFV